MYYCSAYFVISGTLFWRWFLIRPLEEGAGIPVFPVLHQGGNCRMLWASAGLIFPGCVGGVMPAAGSGILTRALIRNLPYTGYSDTSSCSTCRCWIQKKPDLIHEIWDLLVALLHISCIALGKAFRAWSSLYLIQQQSFLWQHCELDSASSPSLSQALHIPQWCNNTCALHGYLIWLKPFACKAICYLGIAWMCNWIKFLIQQNVQTRNRLKSSKYILENFRFYGIRCWYIVLNAWGGK